MLRVKRDGQKHEYVMSFAILVRMNGPMQLAVRFRVSCWRLVVRWSGRRLQH